MLSLSYQSKWLQPRRLDTMKSAAQAENDPTTSMCEASRCSPWKGNPPCKSLYDCPVERDLTRCVEGVAGKAGQGSPHQLWWTARGG